MYIDLDNPKLVLEVLKLHSRQRLGQDIDYLLVCRNILELHYSSLHLLLDIVIFDPDMHQHVMEHRVLQKIHTTLVVTIYTSRIHLEIKQMR